MLGWEDIDLSRNFFLCMVQVEDQQPVVMSSHRSLTSALYANGNVARHWKAEGGKAEEKTFGSARWLLDVEGIRVKLFPHYIDRAKIDSTAINHTPVLHEKGIRGSSARLLKIVRQQLTQISEEPGIVGTTDIALPEEVNIEATYYEGAVRQVVVNAYERNSQAREKCIAHYGAYCFICRFDFGKVYGQVGTGYIHVHHLRQLVRHWRTV